MDNDFDYCEYVRNIAKDPKAKVPQLTIKQFLLMRAHVHICEICSKIIDNVISENPKKSNEGISLN